MSKYKNYAKSYSRMALSKKNTYASNCGAGKEGNAGFQSGNTCGGEGKGGGSEEPKKPKKPKKSDTGAGEGGGIWWGGNYAELNIPQEAVDEIAQSGANDEAVASWHGDIDFSNISDEQLKNELEQHDLGEANMKDRESQEKALLWMSAHDIKEDPDSYAPDTGAGDGGGDAPADEVADMVSSIKDAGGRNLGDIEGDMFASKQELRDELETMYHYDAMDEGVDASEAITDAHVDAVWDSLGSDYVTEEERVGTSGTGAGASYNPDKHYEGTSAFIDDLLESRDKRRKSTDPDDLRSMVDKIAKENWDSETGTIREHTDLYPKISNASEEGGLSLSWQEITSIQAYMEDELIQQADTGAGDGSEDWRDQEVEVGSHGIKGSDEREPIMEKWGDMVSDYADLTWDSQGNTYEGQVLQLNSKSDVQRFLDYTWTDSTGESIAPQGFVDAVWKEVEKNLKVLGDEFDDDGNRTNAPEVDTGAGEARIETDVAIPEDEPTDAYEPSKMESKTREVDSIRGHKIMPKALSSKVPPLGSQDGKGKDAIVYAKFFDPQGSATWYMTEFDPKTGDAFGYADMFGSGDSQSAEMGYFNVWEIGQTMGKMGIPMERDNYWTEKTINESVSG